jgi:hypothetical protein
MTGPERRSEPRTPLKVRLVGWLSGPGLPHRVAAVVAELSPRGCGLYLGGPVESGANLTLELASGPVVLRRPLGLRVTHVRLSPSSGLKAGAEFLDPLSDADLHAAGVAP